MLTSIYQGGLPHLQISRILLLHRTPLQRNNNDKNNKQKHTHKQIKVRFCHVLNGRRSPLVLALMTSALSSEEGRESVRWEVSRSQKLRNFFLFLFFCFWSPVCSWDLAKNCKSFYEPQRNAIIGPKQAQKPFQILKVRN